MTLLDTSVWVDHLRRSNDEVAGLLVAGEVLCHPFVVGELACGRLTNRREILALIQALPQAPVLEHHEALQFVETHRLHTSGVGWIDVHLLASAVLAGARLWTADRRLANAAKRVRVA